MSETKIEYVDYSWNPVTGCDPVSEGCLNCYAKRMAKRLAGRCGYPESPNEFKVTLHPDKLEEPYHWHKPKHVFVCSMSDLFHEKVPFEFIAKVLNVAAVAYARNKHHFLFLTKRPQRLLEYEQWAIRNQECTFTYFAVGVTTENQARYNERVPLLLQIPAAVRFVSIEPMLEAIDLEDYIAPQYESINTEAEYNPIDKNDWRYNTLDWVVLGGETGYNARPMQLAWAQSVQQQCEQAHIPFFFKSTGGSNKSDVLNGKTYKELPVNWQ